MVKIEDLVAQISDERLQKVITAEVKALKKTKKFGIVFWEHLRETVLLPRLPGRMEDLVVVRNVGDRRQSRRACRRKGNGDVTADVRGVTTPMTGQWATYLSSPISAMRSARALPQALRGRGEHHGLKLLRAGNHCLTARTAQGSGAAHQARGRRPEFGRWHVD